MRFNPTFIKVLRVLLSVILIVFSLNGFFSFLPMPEPPEAAARFLQALGEAGYVFPLLYGVEIIIGVLLLLNRYTPLALLAFSPIALNILLYHLVLDPMGGIAGYLTVLIGILLSMAYFGHYRALLQKG
ncbi:MAG TPA: DoxX family membrane protein [Bacteroidales bacterium]|nr:DoxX family membrane protein [Bacteroidales bacterium]